MVFLRSPKTLQTFKDSPASLLVLSPIAKSLMCVGGFVANKGGIGEVIGPCGLLTYTNWGSGIVGGVKPGQTLEGSAAHFSGNGTSNGTFLQTNVNVRALKADEQNYSVVSRIMPGSFSGNAQTDTVGIGKSPGLGGISFGFDTSNHVQASWNSDGGGTNLATGTTVYSSVYVTVGVSASGANAVLYENGINSATGSGGSGTNADPGVTVFYIGRGTRNVTADVGWAFAFNRNLTASEHLFVAQHPYLMVASALYPDLVGVAAVLATGSTLTMMGVG